MPCSQADLSHPKILCHVSLFFSWFSDARPFEALTAHNLARSWTHLGCYFPRKHIGRNKLILNRMSKPFRPAVCRILDASVKGQKRLWAKCWCWIVSFLSRVNLIFLLQTKDDRTCVKACILNSFVVYWKIWKVWAYQLVMIHHQLTSQFCQWSF